ncbi:MAG: glutathione S-transferase family protein, partial [Dongiaceae bacterium]
QKSDEAAIETILNGALPKVFGYLEGSIGGEYLAGGRFGIADIATVSNLINFHYLGFDIDSRRFPKLRAYFAKRLRHPSIAAALRAEQSVAAAMGLDSRFVQDLSPVEA